MSHSTFVRHFLICGLDTAAGLELDDAGTLRNFNKAIPARLREILALRPVYVV